MKNVDVFIVRILPFFLYTILGLNVYLTWNGFDMTGSYLLHSNSVLYSSAFFVISLCNKRYHCVYNRLMYVVLIVIPIINFIANYFDLNDYTYEFMIAFFVMYILVLLITAYLAIDHFVQVTKRRKKHAKSN
jgi:uncharacterized membrane protein YhaH (DUF805 family)